VIFTQNHDQVANSLHGDRLTAQTSPARYRALTAFMLLAPQTPLLFMGQEFGASQPFLFFADHRDATLVTSVNAGRKQFLAQFPSYGSREAQALIPDPCAPATFARSKLDLSERTRHAPLYQFHQDLLRIRRDDPLIARQDHTRLDGAVLGPEAFVVRFFGDSHETDRLLVVNLGRDFEYKPAPEPLLAPRPGETWDLLWSSDDPHYGGPGVVSPSQPDGWHLLGASATLLTGRKNDEL
jgi:maltooligosyltrehalose trehalohydrolase